MERKASARPFGANTVVNTHFPRFNEPTTVTSLIKIIAAGSDSRIVSGDGRRTAATQGGRSGVQTASGSGGRKTTPPHGLGENARGEEREHQPSTRNHERVDTTHTRAPQTEIIHETHQRQAEPHRGDDDQLTYQHHNRERHTNRPAMENQSQRGYNSNADHCRDSRQRRGERYEDRGGLYQYHQQSREFEAQRREHPQYPHPPTVPVPISVRVPEQTQDTSILSLPATGWPVGRRWGDSVQEPHQLEQMVDLTESQNTYSTQGGDRKGKGRKKSGRNKRKGSASGLVVVREGGIAGESNITAESSATGASEARDMFTEWIERQDTGDAAVGQRGEVEQQQEIGEGMIANAAETLTSNAAAIVSGNANMNMNEVDGVGDGVLERGGFGNGKQRVELWKGYQPEVDLNEVWLTNNDFPFDHL